MSQKKDNTLLFKRSMFEVAKLIFNNPNKSFHIRELERLTKLSTTAVISAVDELQKYKFHSTMNFLDGCRAIKLTKFIADTKWIHFAYLMRFMNVKPKTKKR